MLQSSFLSRFLIIDGIKVNSPFLCHLFQEFERHLEGFRQLVPKGLILYVACFRVRKIFFRKLKIHATGGEGTTFTPPITVIVNPADKTRIFAKLLKLFFIHHATSHVLNLGP